MLEIFMILAGIFCFFKGCALIRRVQRFYDGGIAFDVPTSPRGRILWGSWGLFLHWGGIGLVVAALIMAFT